MMTNQYSRPHRPDEDEPMTPMVPDGFPPLAPAEMQSASDTLSELDVSSRNRITLAYELRQHLQRSAVLFDRDGPARLILGANGPYIERLTADAVAIEAQRVCRPVMKRTDRDGNVRIATSVPHEVCTTYLKLSGEHGLRPIYGITGAPIVTEAGEIRSGSGYCPETKLWQHDVPVLSVPDEPEDGEARAAFARLRARFATFPFADAEVSKDPDTGIVRVRQDLAPGHDETAFLVALMTAVQRQSLELAPGVVIKAPLQSGSGTGKGQLAKALAYIATGKWPYASTTGHSLEEMDKRLSAELLSGDPVIFLDNVNGTAFKSNTLASAITEPLARIRIMRTSDTAVIQGRACIVITGNGLSLSEDLVSRFLLVQLDAGVENPELRPVPSGFLDGIQRDRISILEDLLLIYRWGRRQTTQGKALRNFTAWARRCRDPFLALGCPDPVDQVAHMKTIDPMRQYHAEIVRLWEKYHGTQPVSVAALHPELAALIAPKGTRQMLAAAVQQFVDMRVEGAVIVRTRASGRNTAALYSLRISQG